MPHPGPSAASDGLPIGEILLRLRTTLQAQAEAINTDTFDALDQLAVDREQLGIELRRFTSADLDATDHALAEQVGALDQQLIEMTRQSIQRTGQEIRDLDRGRTALHQYGQRGRQLIQNLAHLNGQD